MAYNSDGYIMVDFAEVDFRQTNQFIEGLFDRLRKVIGTNKFVLVINANGKTPLPSTVSITNGQYVIESCIYTFSVNSSDMLHIKRNSPDPESLIDDTVTTTNKTWSSTKINSELDTKADSTALAAYQPLLIAGDNIGIINNVISADLSGVTIKSITYTGTGTTSNDIVFTTTPKFILGIYGISDQFYFGIKPFYYGCGYTLSSLIYQASNTAPAERTVEITYAGNTMTISGYSQNYAMNTEGVEFTVYYI